MATSGWLPACEEEEERRGVGATASRGKAAWVQSSRGFAVAVNYSATASCSVFLECSGLPSSAASSLQLYTGLTKASYK
jgi:hypothetical protein